MSESKSVSVPSFSGKEEDFDLFWPRFEAYANMKGFAEALEWEVPDADLPAEEKTLNADPDIKAKQLAALKRNKAAMASLTLAFKTKACMNMINEAKTEQYPKGSEGIGPFSGQSTA